MKIPEQVTIPDWPTIYHAMTAYVKDLERDLREYPPARAAMLELSTLEARATLAYATAKANEQIEREMNPSPGMHPAGMTGRSGATTRTACSEHRRIDHRAPSAPWS